MKPEHKATGFYYWESGFDMEDIADEYEALVDPDGNIVTVMTEPEDRTGSRDLSAVTVELNRLIGKG